jgi:hypothetical protein
VQTTDTSLDPPRALASATTSSGTPGFVVLTTTLNDAVDNTIKTYYVSIFTGSSSCLVGSVRVTYTVTQTE